MGCGDGLWVLGACFSFIPELAVGIAPFAPQLQRILKLDGAAEFAECIERDSSPLNHTLTPADVGIPLPFFITSRYVCCLWLFSFQLLTFQPPPRPACVAAVRAIQPHNHTYSGTTPRALRALSTLFPIRQLAQKTENSHIATAAGREGCVRLQAAPTGCRPRCCQSDHLTTMYIA